MTFAQQITDLTPLVDLHHAAVTNLSLCTDTVIADAAALTLARLDEVKIDLVELGKYVDYHSTSLVTNIMSGAPDLGEFNLEVSPTTPSILIGWTQALDKLSDGSLLTQTFANSTLSLGTGDPFIPTGFTDAATYDAALLVNPVMASDATLIQTYLTDLDTAVTALIADLLTNYNAVKGGMDTLYQMIALNSELGKKSATVLSYLGMSLADVQALDPIMQGVELTKPGTLASTGFTDALNALIRIDSGTSTFDDELIEVKDTIKVNIDYINRWNALQAVWL